MGARRWRHMAGISLWETVVEGNRRRSLLVLAHGRGLADGISRDVRHGDESAVGWGSYHHGGAQDQQGSAAESGPMASGLRAEQLLGVLDQIMRVGGPLHAGEDVDENAPERQNFSH